MKTLRDHIQSVEQWIDQPAIGDEFDIELAPDALLETTVVDIMEDGVVIQADERAMSLLEQHGHVMEEIGRYGAVGSSPGMGRSILEKQVSEHGGGIGPKQHWQDLMQEEPVEEGAMKELAIELEDYKRMSPQEFERAYGMKKADWAMKHHDIIGKENLQVDWTGKTGFDYVRETSAYMARMLELAGVADHKYDKADAVYHEDQAADIVAKKEFDIDAAAKLGQAIGEEEDMEEAKYQGREVPLGKPMKGDVKKSKVYVRGPKGNVVKVNFGDKTMRIKKSNPKRRKSFRARHNCANPGPRHKARYWSCRAW